MLERFLFFEFEAAQAEEPQMTILYVLLWLRAIDYSMRDYGAIWWFNLFRCVWAMFCTCFAQVVCLSWVSCFVLPLSCTLLRLR